MAIKKSILVILIIFLAACASPQTAGQPDNSAQTTTLPPSPEPTATATQLPPTSTTLPTPTPLPTIPAPTAAPVSVEQLTYTAVETVTGGTATEAKISFVNSDGTGFESPLLFEPFYYTGFVHLTGTHLAWSPDGQFLAFDGADRIMGCENALGTDCYTTNYGTYVTDYARHAITQHVENTTGNASWSPDSQHLIVSVRDDNFVNDLYILDIKSGQLGQLTSGPDTDLYPSWSPDGEWIAFVRFDPNIPGCSKIPSHSESIEECDLASIFMIRPDGSDLQLVVEPILILDTHWWGNRQFNLSPAWSPDGKWLTYLTRHETRGIISHTSDISISNVETGEQQLIVEGNGYIGVISPSWSPDGQKLAFSGDPDYRMDIYLWDKDEHSIVNLTQTDDADEVFSVWSLSGEHIAYLAPGGLHIMNADGTNQVVIGREDSGARGIPAWRPEVQFPPDAPSTQAPLERIAFTTSASGLYGASYNAAITFVDSDGTGFEIPSLFDPFYESYRETGKNLAWSPDGRFFAFDVFISTIICNIPESDCSAEKFDTFIADYADGTIVKHIENTLTNTSWSPDNQHLALSIGEEAEGRNFSGDLVVLDAESGEIRQLTSTSSSDLYPSWSPDGEWIAFVRFDPDPDCIVFPQGPPGNEKCNQGTLYKIRPDGSEITLVFDPIMIYTRVTSSSNDAPTWSPDSQWLAFSSGNRDNLLREVNLFIVNVETGKWQLISSREGADIDPAWSPNGVKLAFASIQDSYFDIFVWDMEEETTTQLTQTRTNEYSPVWSPSGEHIAFLSYEKLWIMNADGTNWVLIEDDYRSVISNLAWQPGGQP